MSVETKVCTNGQTIWVSLGPHRYLNFSDNQSANQREVTQKYFLLKMCLLKGSNTRCTKSF